MNPAQKHLEKINSQIQAGQFAGAAKTAMAAAKKFPKEPGFANAAGAAHARAGNFAQAVSFFNKALGLAPGDPSTQDNLLRALIQAGRGEKALELIAKLEPKRAEKTQLLILKANAQMHLGQPQNVIETTTRILETAPNHAEALSLRGTSHDELKNDDDAIADFERFFELTQDPSALVNLADPLTRRHRPEDALAALEKAVEMAPSDLRAQKYLAIQLSQMGRLADSNAVYKRVLETDPLDGPTYRGLVDSQTAEENLAMVPAIKAAMNKLPTKDERQAFLHLALGNTFFQAKDFEKAAPSLARGNAMLAKEHPYDRKGADAELAAILAAYPQGFALNMDQGDHDTPRPLFVIGLPRSGTTLSEMILSAHPDIANCGEMLSTGKVLTPETLITGADPARLAESYRKELPDDARQSQVFIDKMPSNYRYVGPLLEAFPTARFLHLSRDPRDVALSIWRTYFPATGLRFSFDLTAIAHQANLYKRYMAHWSTLFPDHILTMDYAEVVADVDSASRKMATFCGLDWVPEMAAPEKNTGLVRTASSSQVREGVHTKSVGGWKRMEKALEPFCAQLDPALWSNSTRG
ncbi:sulfotransferase [Shimia thalassica]|uniref:sulfotransferase n=1 Tax=Shimia thalassica TaxID=1715693 RepID=UPI0024950FDC|nr:sulfotransferase family protein [Shimia thalassica]